MKKIIELLYDLNYSDVRPANSIRPARPSPPIGSPPPEIATLDNSVHYPKGTRLEVERDEEREEVEHHKGETWFKSAEYPNGFRVPNAHFRYIDPAKD
jgi:hypothetical protein